MIKNWGNLVELGRFAQSFDDKVISLRGGLTIIDAKGVDKRGKKIRLASSLLPGL